MDERDRRIGLNEALFRQVNEKLEEMNSAFGEISNAFEIICECGDAACVEQIAVPRERYREIRSDATLFFIQPGHEVRANEEVVGSEHGYEVVRKRPGAPADLARETATTD